MPYLIEEVTEAGGTCAIGQWATVKEDGEVMGCHDTKEGAIDQALAIAQAEGSEYLGERRNQDGPPAVIVDIDGTLFAGDGVNERLLAYLDSFEDTEIFIVTARLESDRAQTLDQLESFDVDFDRLYMKPDADTDTVEYKRDTARMLLETYNVMVAIDNDPDNREAFQSLGITAIDVDEVPVVPMDDSYDMLEDRQVDLEPPAYMRASARRGVEWYEAGRGGDGLVDATIREARAMAEGNVSVDKWARIAAWIPRHLVDLDAPAANPEHPAYPSPGVVAMALWGGGVNKRQAERALEYARGVVARIAEENEGRAKGQAVSKLETRINSTKFEVREDADGMTFEGYAAVFNSASEPLPFIERIAPGAFKRTLRERSDVKLLWNHDSNHPLASTRAGSLKLTEDSRGLKVEARLANTQAGRDAAELIRSNVVDAMSFGFTVPEGGAEWNENGTERTLKSVRLFEVSIVPWPAYPSTAGTVSVRGLAALAQRASVDVDALADALMKLENGESISTDERQLIDQVLDEVAPKDDEKPEDDKGLAMLQLKKKKLELLLGL